MLLYFTHFLFILIPFPPSLRCSRWFKFFSESFGTLCLLTLPTGSPLTPSACSLGRHPPSSAAAQVPPLPCPCRRRATAPPSPVLRCGRRFPLLSLLRLDARDHLPPRGPTYPPNFLPRRSTWRQVLLTYQGSFPPTTAYEGLSFLSKDTNLVAAEDVHGNRATYHNNINLSMVLCVT